MNPTTPRKVKIAFTSCARYEAFPDQPHWRDIENTNPDYLFLLGDQIYMDFGYWPFDSERNGAPKRYPADKFERIMNEKYERQWNEPNFKRLFDKMQAKNAVYGVWDDHDFAWNNALGSEVPPEIRRISRDCFHRKMNCSTNHPEVYCHIDIPGARVIFLDNRYYASKASLLGAEQFEFLADKLNHPQKYTFICAGLTLTHSLDNWTRYRGDYNKLCALIEKKKHVIFLAGDIHRNAFAPPTADRNCYEIVSSGMAINYFGLPFHFDDRRNWGLLEFDEDEILVSLNRKNRSDDYRIDGHSWAYEKRQNGNTWEYVKFHLGSLWP